jgi:hypothetical protein
LIEKLGSADFKLRNAAMAALKERTNAAPALREALRSPDAEIRRRATEILDYFETRPVRDLQTAVKQGRLDQFFNSLAAVPEDKFNDAVWHLIRDLSISVVKKHEEKGGEKIKLLHLVDDTTPLMLCSKRIDQNTKATLDRIHFLRADEIDLDFRNRRFDEELKNDFFCGHLTAAANGRLRMLGGEWSYQAIFSRGPVEIDGTLQGVLIVSGGDLTISGDLYCSLLIARGNVSISRGAISNRIISGKSVKHSSTRPNMISENDFHPLGDFHWEATLKEKSVPKSK